MAQSRSKENGLNAEALRVRFIALDAHKLGKAVTVTTFTDLLSDMPPWGEHNAAAHDNLNFI